jgi:hypothetical protein
MEVLMTTSETEEICCPRFDPSLWDGKTLEWENKKFVKAKVFTFFYIPITMDKVMTQLDKQLSAAGVAFVDAMALSEHTSLWNMDQYLAVEKEVAGLNNVTLSGKFLCKVYEGPFEDTGKWMKDFEGYNKANNIKVTRWFTWYTTCPKCAKKYGKNYVAVLGMLG